MCGIAGTYNASGKEPNLPLLQVMAQHLHHRGPDGRGFFCDQGIGLAHTRLSIIDLKGGDQPIYNETRRIVTVFNGEIYNYIELRQELEAKGHHFYTRSDTEVIVHLYEEHGLDFVSYLNGQFAIALWDCDLERLVLIRDRIGIAPLFYYQNHDGLVFGSEIKSLLPAFDSSPSIDLQAINQIFTHWTTQAPYTSFLGIRELSPGHLLIADKSGIQTRCYWDFSYPVGSEAYHSGSLDALSSELYELLYDATKIRLRSDVPVAAYLSGGLDSSTLVSIVHQCVGDQQRTFSIAFESEDHDESPYQRAMIDHIAADHDGVSCSNQQIGEGFSDVIWHAESPLIRTAPTPMKFLSKLVHDSDRKVVLTGEGADEIFGGYDIFKEAKVRRFWSVYPESTWRPMLLKRLYPYLNVSNGSAFKFTRNFYRVGLEAPDMPLFSHLPRIMTTEKIKQFLRPEHQRDNQDVQQMFIETLPADFANWSAFCRSQYIEKKLLLRGYLLSSQGDRMLMANSVEGRYPFLDHRVIEFANALDPRLKMHVLNEKYLLKNAMRSHLPKQIVSRYKQPYRAPDVPAFFASKTPDYVHDLMSEQKIRNYGYFDSKKVAMLLKKAQQGRVSSFADNMSFVAILSTQLLHYHFIENFGKHFRMGTH